MNFKKIKQGLAGIFLAGALGTSLNAQNLKTEFDKVYSPLDTYYENVGIEKQKPDLSYPLINNSFDKQTQIPPINLFYESSKSEKEKKDWFFHGLEASLIGLNVADLILTNKALKKGAIEINPLVELVNRNPYALVGIKATLIGSALYINRKIREDDPKFSKGLLIGANLVYGFVVANNFSVVRKL